MMEGAGLSYESRDSKSRNDPQPKADIPRSQRESQSKPEKTPMQLYTDSGLGNCCKKVTFQGAAVLKTLI